MYVYVKSDRRARAPRTNRSIESSAADADAALERDDDVRDDDADDGDDARDARERRGGDAPIGARAGATRGGAARRARVRRVARGASDDDDDDDDDARAKDEPKKSAVVRDDSRGGDEVRTRARDRFRIHSDSARIG